MSQRLSTRQAHTTSDGARHIERAQEKEVEVTEGNETGSWQIKEKEEEI
jgi:hypothetical protein